MKDRVEAEASEEAMAVFCLRGHKCQGGRCPDRGVRIKLPEPRKRSKTDVRNKSERVWFGVFSFGVAFWTSR